MKALACHGRRDVRIDTVPGSDDRGAHRRDRPDHDDGDLRFGPASLRGARAVHRGRLDPRPRADGHRGGGRQRGHRPVGRRPRGDPVPDRLRHCFMCDQGLQTQCETTQVREEGMGAALFGYTKLYGSRPAARPSTCACRRPSTRTSRCRRGRPTSASSTSPTCCRPRGRRCEYAGIPDGGSVRCSASGRSATWPPDRAHRGLPRDRRRPRPRAARARRGPAAPRCSTCASTTTTSPRSSAG